MEQQHERYKATIREIEDGQVVVEIEEGSLDGESFQVALFDEVQIQKQGLQTGDQVLVSILPGTEAPQVIIVDQFRLWPLVGLFALFILVVVVIGRLKGIMSFIGMLFSFLIIGRFLIPQILMGNNPLLISLFAALLIIPITFYIAHGITWKTTIAIAGTFIALLITGLLAWVFVHVTKLTGFAAEEATFLQMQDATINIQSLLLAGIIIGAMGVLDDITIAQTSLVAKLRQANPKYTRWHLFAHAMDVGRDHIASLVNTLVLVYAGASLPLFVLFSSTQFGSFTEVINMELVATEIVRTLVSSIGIVSAVPVTTLLAVLYLKKDSA